MSLRNQNQGKIHYWIKKSAQVLMMILYGKEGLRNTLLYQNHARNSNLGSNLFITYIIGEIIDSFTKNHYFLNKFNFGSPFQHDATICDKSVCKVKLPQNHGLSDEVCLNLLYRPIHVL